MATDSNAVFNSSGKCSINDMQENADGSWTLTATIAGLTIVWTDAFGTSYNLPTVATFTTTVPADSGVISEGFLRESIWSWDPAGDGPYTVTCSGFHMSTS